jgi:N-acetylglucosaminyldiphosphoundecaprenol N-acetyl-beta-D-mannosaminyltransferase
MNKYFGINLEFDPVVFFQTINEHVIAKKSCYVCVVDGNVLSYSRRYKNYQQIINSSCINSCDGSSIAFFLKIIYNKDFKELTGPSIFTDLIIKKKFSQLIIGGNYENYLKILDFNYARGCDNTHVRYYDIPFLNIDRFDFEQIANDINSISPDIIWVSLGAPKQEYFMYKLKPFLNKGVMVGIGAAINFYTGKINSPKFNFFGLKFIWINRIISEPKKVLTRAFSYLIIIPGMLIQETKFKFISKYKS